MGPDLFGRQTGKAINWVASCAIWEMLEYPGNCSSLLGGHVWGDWIAEDLQKSLDARFWGADTEEFLEGVRLDAEGPGGVVDVLPAP